MLIGMDQSDLHIHTLSHTMAARGGPHEWEPGYTEGETRLHCMLFEWPSCQRVCPGYRKGGIPRTLI